MPETNSKQTIASGSKVNRDRRPSKAAARCPYGNKDHRPSKAAAASLHQDRSFARYIGTFYYDILPSRCATAAHFLLAAREAPKRSDLTEIYGLNFLDILPIGDDAKLKRVIKLALVQPITAHRLNSLVIRGNNSDAVVQTELADALHGILLPDLETIKILRPGRSSAYFERAIYHLFMLWGETGELRHVSLQWHCCYQAGFTKWLESAGAANLATLRLQTNADVRTRITDALKGGHWFPKLRRLSLLNIQGLTPKTLLETLRVRYNHGMRRRLVVEITGDVPSAIVKAAQKINVVFQSVADGTPLEPTPHIEESSPV
ncbi:hypothetical protein K525DRAFT_248954 [Schizophyllum commune Loenen D]|nr:hypothetical protein K525DRAFT_248954 [Schizophyllum commune Loenen D]